MDIGRKLYAIGRLYSFFPVFLYNGFTNILKLVEAIDIATLIKNTTIIKRILSISNIEILPRYM